MQRRWNAGSWGGATRTLCLLVVASLGSACAGISSDSRPDSATAEKGTAPVRLDPQKLAGVGLEEYDVMSAEEVLEGGNRHRGEVVFLRDELAVGIWEADAATLAVSEPVEYEEFVTVLSGKLILTDADGNVTECSAGESVVVPKGFSGTWQMLGDFREIYVMEASAFVKMDGSD